MEGQIRFLYEKEYWYASVFINSQKIRIHDKVKEIEELIIKKVNNLTENDLKKISWNKKWVEKVIEMGKNLSISLDWTTFLEGFPYHDENTNLTYDKLGFIQFDVEYYKGNEEKKSKIEHILIQQIPIVISNLLRDFCALKVNDYINIDTESPIFDFVISDKTTPVEIEWSEENIKKYKRDLGDWTEVYSGAWPDYNEKLYDRRTEGNLSNRLSELHFIRDNSGFIYMKEENYKLFWSYMSNFVLLPTAQIRAIQFALMSINSSLDILYLRQTNEDYMEISIIEEKMRQLKHLRGLIQTHMSNIYNELDYNRRQHYTSVLRHLVKTFNLEKDGIIERITNKFEIIYDSMQHLYSKKTEESQKLAEKGVNTLNVLFSLGILGDFAGLFLGALEKLPGADIIGIILNSVSSLVIGVVFIMTMIQHRQARIEAEKIPIKHTVDAVILDGKGKVVMILRKDPPFKGQYALPGGFVEPGESYEQAIIREVKEETHLDIKVKRLIGVYDAPDRDPRGKVISHAYLCKCICDFKNLEGDDDADIAELVSLETLRGLDLAFDHEDILCDALNPKSDESEKSE